MALPPMPEWTGEWTSEVKVWVALMRQLADNGDERAADALSRAVRQHPALLAGDVVLAPTAEAAWVALLVPGGVGRRWDQLTVQAEVDQLRRDLLGERPTPLERLLVDRVVVCHLAAQWAEANLASRLAGDMSIALATFYGNEVERHGRRLLRAVETLAKVRRALGPGVTLNVALPGGQQVNVGSMAVGASGVPALDHGEGEPVGDLVGRVFDAPARERAGVLG